MSFRYLAKDAVTLAGLLMPSCVEMSLKTNMIQGGMFKVIEAKYDPWWDVFKVRTCTRKLCPTWVA